MDRLHELLPGSWPDDPTLADLAGSASSALGFGADRPLPIPDSHTVVILMVDGLGDLLLHEHSVFAPTLLAHRSMPLRVGFPSTTATSLTSLGTGLPCAEHGVLGYSFAPRDLDPAVEHTLNALRWTLDTADGPPADGLYPPTEVQPMPSAFDELTHAGAAVITLMPELFRESGLTRAAYGTPADYRDASSPNAVRDQAVELLAAGDQGPRLVYAYLPNLDAAGHRWGPGTPEWQERLRRIDDVAAAIVEALQPGATLVVTGDHGMITAGRRIDIDTTPALTEGVRAVGGEARVRHVYAEPGRADDVFARWAHELDGHAHVATRDQVLAERWFGAPAAAHVTERIGDVVAVAGRDTLLTRSVHEPMETMMPGHHGGWTVAELLVPLIIATG
ncbi:alkaline phosphatase family protein [Gordonia alkaliphila]|uniref:alkaline phosphatase family protein n=1 Tax=Gordonia alkaliphila TaxID=1053547 RepID=UPI001FF6FBEF|nr:nucleotide pyrophosphatase/phosphodiesterase family protein [Gordonia alkaliphila]MCK0440802.1 alkaline phosphatase family protein [Gordonia alkaliphila]